MSNIALFILAISLGMDALAVAMAVGFKLGRATWQQMARLSLAFGFFQWFMPLIGWLAGQTLALQIQAYDHWVALGLLGLIGTHMILSGVSHEKFQWKSNDPTQGWLLLTLAIATSIDALAVGISFALLAIVVWMPALVIGVVAALMTLLGISMGARLGLAFGKRMEILGGLILYGIGIKILLEHISI